MKKTKIMSLALAAALGASMLTGCGTGSGGIKKVTVWSGNSHSKVVVSRLVDEFNKDKGKKLGVKIDYIVKEGDSASSIDLAYDTGDEPEFCSTGNIKKLAEDGKIVALEDLPGGAELLAEYDENDYKNFQTDGKTYKIPYGATTQGLIYNKDMFKKYGIVDENGEAKPPETLEEMREDAKIMTNEAEHEYGIVIPLSNEWLYNVEVMSLAKASCNFREFDWEKGEFDYTSHTPVLELYAGIKQDNSYFPGADNMDNDTARAQFAQGKIGMKIGASYDVGVLNDQFPAKCDWGVAPYPTAVKGERYKTELASNGFLVINKKAVDNLGAETAMEIFNFFHDDAMMTELYKEGMEIPCKNTIVENTKIDNPKKGWTDFAALVNSSTVIRWDVPGAASTGAKTGNDYFLQDLWTGKMTPAEITAAMTKERNESMRQWFEKNTDKNQQDYIMPNYSTRME